MNYTTQFAPFRKPEYPEPADVADLNFNMDLNDEILKTYVSNVDSEIPPAYTTLHFRPLFVIDWYTPQQPIEPLHSGQIQEVTMSGEVINPPQEGWVSTDEGWSFTPLHLKEENN